MRQSILPSEAGAFETPQRRATLATLRRHAAPLLAWLATFCYAAWQLVAQQKLFLHTFLVERVGNPGVAKLPLGYGNVLALKSIMLWQQLRGDPDALKDVQHRIYQRIHRRLQARGVATGQVRPLAEYRMDEITPRRFYREHVRRGVPCVLRGFVPASDRWHFAQLAERFPNAIGQVMEKRTKRVFSTTLRAIFEDGRREYIAEQALLDQNPALKDYFEVERSNAYFPVLGRSSKPILSFLIIGLGSGLNANFHCEESVNWYLAVSGAKRWTLVEAEYSWLLYPAARGTGLRRFSAFLADEEGEPRDKAAYPLAAYAPRYEVVLRPGDVLYFPAWMWHKTVNLDDEGLGVTCRYAPTTVMSNRYFRALQLLSPAFWTDSVKVLTALIRRDMTGLEDASEQNEQESVLI
ncbi:MAG TPA: cupin-like domain-containing protein [Geminicoccaceae bacterium]|nr:cupin-like domain-containing protein [Geminicoccaceae bacterium]